MPKKELPRCCKNGNIEKDILLLIDFLKVVSDANRMKIICILKCGERNVEEIYSHLNLAQNLVSHHLKVLRQANILKAEKEGLHVIYSLNKKIVNKYLAEFNEFMSK